MIMRLSLSVGTKSRFHFHTIVYHVLTTYNTSEVCLDLLVSWFKFFQQSLAHTRTLSSSG